MAGIGERSPAEDMADDDDEADDDAAVGVTLGTLSVTESEPKAGMRMLLLLCDADSCVFTGVECSSGFESKSVVSLSSHSS
jgi:hypothetical protein